MASKKPERHKKTPRQRAEEQLGVAERVAKRLDEKRSALEAEYNQVAAEHAAAVKRRDFLAQHPDLETEEEG